MRINVTRLELNIEYHKKQGNDPARRTLMITVQDDKMEYPISPMIHGDRNMERFINQCRSETPWYDTVSFDDVGYQFRVYADGLNVWRMSGAVVDTHFFTFPMKLVAEKIEQAGVTEYRPKATWKFTEDHLASIKKAWWPKARLVFDSPEARERFMSCLRAEPDMFTTVNKMELTRHTRDLMRIARNRSDGEPTVVHMNIDSYPNSFYWYIMTGDGYRVGNGGIIAHAYKDDDGNIEHYEYSVHT